MVRTFQHVADCHAVPGPTALQAPKEIEVEGVGVIRHLNAWQLVRLRWLKGPNRAIAPLAFSLGMTYQQFRGLSPEQKEAGRIAFNKLTAPPPMNWENAP